jgi:septum formation topological specificity factor MinE
MSDTPISDSTPHNVAELGMLCRRLERQLNAANERIPLLIAERDTARRQADQKYKLREEFLDLLGTNDVEQGVAAVREMKERIKRLEEALTWYESKAEDCNRHGSEGVAARDALANDLGRKAKEAKL